ncbi:MAG: adenine phosphoribosyltransferase [Bacillota bacterium]
MDLADKVRTIEDFPKPGIKFKDITTLLSDSNAFQVAINRFVERYQEYDLDVVVGIESRGFLVGTPLALELGKGFVPARKEGKLPAQTVQAEYDLEYGTNTLELHVDAINPGDQVLIIDDLLATGGTAKAVTEMVEELGGEVVELAFLIELIGLDRDNILEDYPVYSVIKE